MILIPSLFHSPHSRKWWGKGFSGMGEFGLTGNFRINLEYRFHLQVIAQR